MLPILTPPAYRLHKSTGLGVVRLNGRDIYLGRHNTPESRAKYDRVIAEWLANHRQLPTAPAAAGDGSNGVTVADLIADYWNFAEKYYRGPDGTPSNELSPLRYALRPLNRLYGNSPAIEFGPLKLKAVRETMVEARWARANINHQIQRIVRMFRWCVENERIPAEVHLALKAVAGLKKGRSNAKESTPVRPVAEATVEQVIPYVCAEVAAMIRVQHFTLARPGEVVIMRACDIDMREPMWIYRPTTHKGQHREQERKIQIGPRAQEVIRPFLGTNLQAFLFSPAKAASARKAEKKRKSRQRGAERLRGPGERYTVATYRRAIARACDDAFPLPPALEKLNEQVGEWRRELWRVYKRPAKLAEMPAEMRAAIEKIEAHRVPLRFHPHQLRHSGGTRIRAEFGPETAQAVLGHRNLSTTEIYAERNDAAAAKAMQLVG